MNIQKMMKQAQKLQADMLKSQEELAQKTVEASVGGGKVIVTACGTGEIRSITISKDVVDPSDVEFLQDLILSGIKQAQTNAKSLSEAEMGRYTAQLPF